MRMKKSAQLPSNKSMRNNIVAIVKNRCQFCYAFFKNVKKSSEHSKKCDFRFFETFEAFDGQMKFACSVCYDVFTTRDKHAQHERLHKFPGGYSCPICDELFLNDFECDQHMMNLHQVILKLYTYI